LWSTRDLTERDAGEFSAAVFAERGENDAFVLRPLSFDNDEADRVLTVPDAATKAGSKVVLMANAKEDHQKWLPIDRGDGWWSFEPQHVNGAALACKGVDLPLIISVAKETQLNQQWRFTKGENGDMLLENRAFMMTAEADIPAPPAGDLTTVIPMSCRRSCGRAPKKHQAWRVIRVLITEEVIETTEESGSNVILVTGDAGKEIRVDPETFAVSLVAEAGAGTVFTVLAGGDGGVGLEFNGKWLTAGPASGKALVMQEPYEDDAELVKTQQWGVDYADDATFFSPASRPADVMDVVDGVAVTAPRAEGREEQKFSLTVVNPDEVKTSTETKTTVAVK
jgi:hypothetical protein